MLLYVICFRVHYEFEVYLVGINGLVLVLSSSYSQSDYELIFAENGLIHYTFNPGGFSSMVTLTNAVNINDGNWHNVKVTRKWKDVSLTVDESTITGTAVGYSTISHTKQLFVGGKPAGFTTFPFHPVSLAVRLFIVAIVARSQNLSHGRGNAISFLSAKT